jgi:[ribosomal protein S5]-alanine N-acetyltransferase
MKASELHSKRLIFRPLDRSFASEEYVSWLNDPEVIRYMETGGDYTCEKIKLFLKSVEEKEMLFWAILLKSGKHIGNIKIDPVHWKYRNGEYGIMMGDRNEWGKGYAKEASETIIDHCFSEPVNLRKITLGVVEDNFSALKLYEKLGFEVEGIYKKHAFHEGKWCNVVRMAKFNDNSNGISE